MGREQMKSGCLRNWHQQNKVQPTKPCAYLVQRISNPLLSLRHIIGHLQLQREFSLRHSNDNKKSLIWRLPSLPLKLPSHVFCLVSPTFRRTVARRGRLRVPHRICSVSQRKGMNTIPTAYVSSLYDSTGFHVWRRSL